MRSTQQQSDVERKKDKAASGKEPAEMGQQESGMKSTLLVVQGLRFLCFQGRGPGSIPGWETKIPHATAKTQHSQKMNFKKEGESGMRKQAQSPPTPI